MGRLVAAKAKKEQAQHEKCSENRTLTGLGYANAHWGTLTLVVLKIQLLLYELSN